MIRIQRACFTLASLLLGAALLAGGCAREGSGRDGPTGAGTADIAPKNRAASVIRSGEPGAGPGGTTPVYNGGDTISNPKVVAVYWGSNVAGVVTSQVPSFYTAVLDSQYMDWLDEYYSAIATIGPIGRGTFAGAFTITPSSHSNSLTDAIIDSELASQINAGSLPKPDADTIYMIYLPSGVSATLNGCGTSCVQWCGCHTDALETIGGVQTLFAFGVIPDMVTDCAEGCGSGTAFQNASYASSHEMIEATTDPFPPQGWSPELGDPCNQNNTTLTDSGGNQWTVQNILSVEANACIDSRPNCQLMSDTYGIVAGGTWGFAPSDVQSWWTANGCSTSPSGTSTSLCQKASEVYGIAAGVTFGYAPSSVQTWWQNQDCGTSPLTSKTLCQRASDTYGITAFATWGSAPSYVRSFWTTNDCGNSTTGQDACQKAADLFGIEANGTWGWATSDVQSWWTSKSCNATTRTALLQQCQNASDYYAIVAGSTFGGAPSSVQTWWNTNHCDADPVCQDVSEIFGVSANVTFGYAPSYVQSWWSGNHCGAKPLFSSDTCQRAANTFGIVADFTFGFAPTAVQSWWTGEGTTCEGHHPRDDLRHSFANGPTP